MYEISALQPRDESLHEEEWPLFKLNDVSVLSRKRNTHELMDLLEVSLKGPFRIKGRLQPVTKEQKHLVLQQQVFKQDILICNVNTYSLEQKVDGSLVIWALGSCGWYALSPSAEYKPFFKQMVEKAKLWLWIEEKYPPELLQSKKKIRDTMRSLYSDFAEDHAEWPEPEHAEALITKYHKWIILKITEGINNSIDWKRTPLYQELLRQHKSVFEEVAPILGRLTLPRTSSNMENTQRKTIVVTTRTKEDTEIKAESATSFSSSSPSPEEKDTMEEEEGEQEEEDYQSESEEEEEEEEDAQPRSSKGKSVLRPRVSEIFATPTKEPSSPLGNYEGPLESNSESEENDRNDNNNYADDTSHNSLKLSGSKHGYYEDQEEAVDPEKLTKRLRTLHAQSKKQEHKEQEESYEDMVWPPLVPGRGRAPITVYQMLPTTANVGDIFVCPIHNCGHRIFETDTVQGRKTIEAHYEDHARKMQEAKEVIGFESKTSRSRGPYRNIDHLLQKIEEMAEEWQRSLQ